MSYPATAREAPLQAPRGRSTNIAARITPVAFQGRDYFPGFTVVASDRLRVLNTAGFAWWVTEGPPAATDQQFSSAFSSAYQGGLGSPQNP